MTVTLLDMGPGAPKIDEELKVLEAEIAGLLREVLE